MRVFLVIDGKLKNKGKAFIPKTICFNLLDLTGISSKVCAVEGWPREGQQRK